VCDQRSTCATRGQRVRPEVKVYARSIKTAISITQLRNISRDICAVAGELWILENKWIVIEIRNETLLPGSFQCQVQRLKDFQAIVCLRLRSSTFVKLRATVLLGYWLMQMVTSLTHIVSEVKSSLKTLFTMLPLMLFIHVTTLIMLMLLSKQARGRPTWSLRETWCPWDHVGDPWTLRNSLHSTTQSWGKVRKVPTQYLWTAFVLLQAQGSWLRRWLDQQYTRNHSNELTLPSSSSPDTWPVAIFSLSGWMARLKHKQEIGFQSLLH